MREGWELKKLGDVCHVTAGQSPKSTFYNSDKNGLPFYQGKKQFGKKYIKEPSTWTTKITKEALKDDILMSVRAPVGPINFATQRICIGRGLAGIRATEKIDKEYLFYFLLHHENKIVGNIGAVFNSINKKQIEDLKILLPFSMDEQKQIVKLLDQAFGQIDLAKAKLEQNLHNAKELFESKLNEVFSQRGEGWVEKRFVEVCSILTCGVASTPKYVDKEVGIPFLSAQNVKNGKVILNKYKYISKDFHAHLTKKNKPQKGDILYSRVGAKYGEAGVVEHDFEFSVYVSVTLIRPLTGILNNYYLKYYLNSPLIKSLAKSSITSSGVPNLNVKSVREFPILFPSVSRQIDIVEDIKLLESNVNILIDNYQQKLNNLEELKKSILEKAFKGELDYRG